MHAASKEKWPACSSMINLFKAYKLRSTGMLNPLHFTQQYIKQRTALKASLKSIQPLWQIWKHQFQTLWTWYISLQAKNRVKNASAINSVFKSHTESITHLPQIVKYVIVKKRMGAQRRTKIAPRCKHCGCCGWQKSTSQDKLNCSDAD